MTLAEKLEKIVSPEPSKWFENAKKTLAEAGWRRKSGAVALRVLAELDERKMTQAALAEKMGVSRQQISKIVKGHENFTFETIYKLEKALGIKLITIAGEPNPYPFEDEESEQPVKTRPAASRAKKEKPSAPARTAKKKTPPTRRQTAKVPAGK